MVVAGDVPKSGGAPLAASLCAGRRRALLQQASGPLPIAPTYGFVGRDRDILQIEKRLLAPLRTEVKEAELAGRNVLLLRGMGSAGKTTLLHHLGSWWQTTGFVDQVFYFGYDEKAYTLQQLLHQIAAQLLTPVEQAQFQPKSLAAQQAILAQRLRSHRHLLILDNLESVTGSDDPDFKNLLKLLDGYPLALEVVLANLTRQIPSQVLQALQAGDVALDRGDTQKKTESILHCIDYSFKNIAPESQALLLCLFPFTSVIHVSALEKYVEKLKQQPALGNLSFEHFDKVIKEATDWGLLSQHPEEPAFLRLQPIFPYFLRSRVDAVAYTEMRQAVAVAFRQHYEGLSAVIFKLMQSNEVKEKQRGQMLGRFEYENLVTSLRYALKEQVSIRNIYGTLLKYLDVTKSHQQGLQLGEIVLSALEKYQAKKLAGELGLEFIGVIDSIANRQRLLKQYEAAESSYQKALSLSKASELDIAKRSQAGFLHQLGMVAQGQHQWQKAEQYYQKALEICIEFDDRYDQAREYLHLGIVAFEQREWSQAEQCYQKALKICIEFNDRYHQALVYHELGILAEEQQEWLLAKQYHQRALKIYLEFNDRYEQARTYHHLGRVAEGRRKWQKAEQYYQNALEIYLEFKDRYEQARTYHQLGMVVQEQRHWQQAELYYHKALETYLEFNDRYEQANPYHQLGVIAKEQRQWQQARGYLLQALEIWVEFHNEHKTEIGLRTLAHLWYASRDASLPRAVAEILKIKPNDAEALLLNVLRGDSSRRSNDITKRHGKSALRSMMAGIKRLFTTI